MRRRGTLLDEGVPVPGLDAVAEGCATSLPFATDFGRGPEAVGENKKDSTQPLISLNELGSQVSRSWAFRPFVPLHASVTDILCVSQVFGPVAAFCVAVPHA